ncbi:phytanoyl-CoA dioxygenase family protein [Nocardia sp. alder85J]|uniref:phytanoyl-CoA dioxygenase family protein n=1 Tax=Nocardia sp. alder85J TaxID=2862949 RepID=UPI001CD27CA4|nr:phytanoyl-CoA dioxygenase family protein [Nocardia sp. alder85J]MCX4091612.1 phytanoyl-CoA dioxygenase family protein [Nocardia sp. alder85J]
MLSDAQLDTYYEDGFVVVPEVLGPAQRIRLRAEVERLYTVDHPGRVLEKDGRTVRAVHGCHRTSPVFSRLVRSPFLLGSAERILDGKVYVHQSKVNAKRALRGDIWPWHQDFVFWEREDGMPAPRATNIAVFLDDATSHNGPLLFVPGSHRLGTVASGRRGEGWKSNLAADLDYAPTAAQLTPLIERLGIRAATGPEGSALLFDPRLIHGSGANMSPVDRQLVIITYNSVDNVPVAVPNRRPDFLCEPDPTALEPLIGEF